MMSRGQQILRSKRRIDMQDEGEGGGGAPHLPDLCWSYTLNEDYKKCCEPDCCQDREALYNNRVLVGNWFEERRQYHQLCSRCTGHSIYRTEYLPYCKEDYMQNNCIPPQKYEYIKRADGVGWNLIRNTEDYCEYLSNYTTTNDLMYNWEVRRANCKYKPKRRWKPIRDNLWLPERDNALPYGNLTQYGFRKAPVLPPVPNDWKTYDMATEYNDQYVGHKYPESYTLCRFSSPKSVTRELEDYLLTYPGSESYCTCDRIDSKANNALCRHCFLQNPKRFQSMRTVKELRPHLGIQTVYGSLKDPYVKLKHPPHTLPFYSLPKFDGPHSCGNPVGMCDAAQMGQDAMKCNQPPCYDNAEKVNAYVPLSVVR